LPAIDLRAYLSERPPGWDPVARIPFGAQVSGLSFGSSNESATTEPSSFAIASDRSIWILDVGNSRIAHYSSGGRFLGAIGGLSRQARDIAFAGDQMWVIDQEQGILAGVPQEGGFKRLVFAEGTHVIHLLELMPGGTALVAHVDSESYVGLVGFGSEKFGVLDVTVGRVSLLSGIPLGGGRWVRVTNRGLSDPNELDVSFVSADVEQVQPFRLHVLTGGAPNGREISSVWGPVEFVVAGQDVWLIVAEAPSRPPDAHFGGGRWLLRVGTDGSPLVWERLPGPGIDDDEQFRHVAVGFDGRLYLMIMTRGGAQILRRR